MILVGRLSILTGFCPVSCCYRKLCIIRTCASQKRRGSSVPSAWRDSSQRTHCRCIGRRLTSAPPVEGRGEEEEGEGEGEGEGEEGGRRGNDRAGLQLKQWNCELICK